MRLGCQAKKSQIISPKSSQNFSLLRILPLCTKIPCIPDLFCVEIKRHKGDLGVSVVLLCNCELMARREVLRLFPEFKHSFPLIDVYLARYVEVDWNCGRSIVVKEERPQPLIPPHLCGTATSRRKKLPRLEDEGDAQ